ncbi:MULTISPECIES: hypothetical protein [unclassified Micromonospora]|uniref:hypothetical protein n=1 Tax=unclassified Micromonospora TaxID=2617518 RepID=UPI003319E7FA
MPRREPITYPSTLPDPRRGYLLAAHVAALFTAVDRENNPDAPVISPATVLDAVRKSRPGGRYAHRPLRPPSGYVGLPPGQVPEFRSGSAVPYWAPWADGETLADVEAELIAWRRGMTGRGVGGGRPRKTGTAGGAR